MVSLTSFLSQNPSSNLIGISPLLHQCLTYCRVLNLSSSSHGLFTGTVEACLLMLHLWSSFPEPSHILHKMLYFWIFWLGTLRCSLSSALCRGKSIPCHDLQGFHDPALAFLSSWALLCPQSHSGHGVRAESTATPRCSSCCFGSCSSSPSSQRQTPAPDLGLTFIVTLRGFAKLMLAEPFSSVLASLCFYVCVPNLSGTLCMNMALSRP